MTPGPATEAERVAQVRLVTQMLGDGRTPGPEQLTDDAMTLGSFFGIHNESIGEPTVQRWADLLEAAPRLRVAPRSIHPVSGERVMLVVVAVQPGSTALAAALFSFRGARISQIECFADAARAFEHVGMAMPPAGTGL